MSPPRTGLSANWFSLWERMRIAKVLDGEGRPAEAIAVLKEDTSPASLEFTNAWNWLQCRLQLAELCRKHGLTKDAAEVENEIRHFLSEADSDHPVLARLRVLQAARQR
jgi:hypothetical protein